MQTQPFVIERLYEDRRADLYAAATETRCAAYSGRTIVGRGVTWLMTATRNRKPGPQARAGASNAQPIASR